MSENIETGIPVPPRRYKTQDFAAMKVGNSLFFPFENGEIGKAQETRALRVYNRAYMWAKRYKQERKWRVAVDEKDGTLGVRLWRIG